MIAKDDPVTCAQYAIDNKLLNVPGWKRFRKYAKNKKVFQRLVTKAKKHSARTAPVYQFGVEVPRSIKHAYELDEKSGTTFWQDAINKELQQLMDYKTFRDMGRGSRPPEGYKNIRVHFVFAVKHDLRRKARCVAGGHMTDPARAAAYSGVVSLRSIRIALLLAELN